MLLHTSKLLENRHWIAASWIKTLETIVQQTISLLHRKRVGRFEIDPENFLLFPIRNTIIHSDMPETDPKYLKMYQTYSEREQLLRCYVEEDYHEATKTLTFKATLSREMLLNYIPDELMNRIEKLLFEDAELKKEPGRRTKFKKGRRGRNHQVKRQTLASAFEGWSKTFDEWKVLKNGRITNEGYSNTHLFQAETKLQSRGLFSDIRFNKRVWFIETEIQEFEPRIKKPVEIMNATLSFRKS